MTRPCRFLALTLLGILGKTGAMNMCFVFFSSSDNNLERAMVEDVNELIGNTKATGNSDFQLWLLQDRHADSDAGGGHTGDPINGHTQEYTGAVIYKYDRSAGHLAVQNNMGEQNVDDPAILRGFVGTALKECKQGGADKFVVVMSDHGAGWYGFGGDDQTRRLEAMAEGTDQVAAPRRLSGMTLDGIREAIQGGLQDAGIQKLDMFGFDACLMAAYSVFAAFHDLSKYFVASLATEPGHGWDYNFLDPGRSDIASFATDIIDGFSDGLHGYTGHQAPKTLGLFDFEKFPAFQAAATAWLQVATSQLLNHKDKTLSTAITRARRETAEFMGVMESGDTQGVADLGLFLQNLKKSCNMDGIDQFISALDAMTVVYKAGPGTTASKGTGVFFPQKRHVASYGSAVYPTWLYESRTDQYISLWNDFLAAYYSYNSNSGSETSVCSVGAAGPTPMPSLSAPIPEGARITTKGCLCRKEWTMEGYPEVTNYCGNPDSDSGGQWCFVVDDVCEGASWGYCKAGTATTPSTPSTPSPTPRPTPSTPSPSNGPSSCPSCQCMDVSASQTGFQIDGQPASCTDLKSYCTDASIQKVCPTTCDACCVTMLGHGSTAPASSRCSQACEPDTQWGTYGWCVTVGEKWGSCTAACWPNGFEGTSPSPTPAPPMTPVPTPAPPTPTAAPTYTDYGVCTNDPLGWRDDGADDCSTYDEYQWCADGGVGSGWDADWGTLSDWPNPEGIDASQACCACGGGKVANQQLPCQCVEANIPSRGVVHGYCADHFDSNEIWCYVPISSVCDPPHNPSSADASLAWIYCDEAADTTEVQTTAISTTTAYDDSSCQDMHIECSDWIYYCNESEVQTVCPESCNVCNFRIDDSCQYAKDDECDEPPNQQFCAIGTDCTDCGTCESPSNTFTTTGGPTVGDTCLYANDDVCDVPDFCAEGTDCTDCNTCNGADIATTTPPNGGDSCNFAKDGECDVEAGWCDIGTDCTDCNNCDTEANVEITDSCYWANDDVCDLLPDCDPGTDCSDCGQCGDKTNDANSIDDPVSDGVIGSRSGGPGGQDNSCKWAFDGECDHDNGYCQSGTDCTDCATCSAQGASDDACASKLNGWCDEGSANDFACEWGTDCTDCGACAAPPEGCVCKGIDDFIPRCSDLLDKGDSPWCYVANPTECALAAASARFTDQYWVDCEKTGPGGAKLSQLPWTPAKGCACVAGHPIAPTCEDHQGRGFPWCYVEDTSSCMEKQQDFVGYWAKCESQGGTGDDHSSIDTSMRGALVQIRTPLLLEVNVARAESGGYDVSAAISPDVGDVQVAISLAYTNSYGRRLSPQGRNAARRMSETGAKLKILEVRGSYTMGGFQANWNGEVPYLRQGSKAGRATFVQEGTDSISVPVVYFAPGIMPRAAGGYYADTGGLLGRLAMSVNSTEPPALYVEVPDSSSGRGMLAAISQKSGGTLAPYLTLEEDGHSQTLLDTLFGWGSAPEVARIEAVSFLPRVGTYPVPYEVAVIGIYADRDPPSSSFWEEVKIVNLDGRGNVVGTSIFPCAAHTQCLESQYCWDCDKCLEFQQEEYCLHCLSGSQLCGNRKFCGCGIAGAGCDSVDGKCPGVKFVPYLAADALEPVETPTAAPTAAPAAPTGTPVATPTAATTKAVSTTKLPATTTLNVTDLAVSTTKLPATTTLNVKGLASAAKVCSLHLVASVATVFLVYGLA